MIRNKFWPISATRSNSKRRESRARRRVSKTNPIDLDGRSRPTQPADPTSPGTPGVASETKPDRPGDGSGKTNPISLPTFQETRSQPGPIGESGGGRSRAGESHGGRSRGAEGEGDRRSRLRHIPSGAGSDSSLFPNRLDFSTDRPSGEPLEIPDGGSEERNPAPPGTRSAGRGHGSARGRIGDVGRWQRRQAWFHRGRVRRRRLDVIR